MDLHIVPGISAKDAAEAHREDLKIQDQYGCRCMTYWVDEERGSAFCLIDAPDKDAVRQLHDRAHGLIPHEIIKVNSNVVEAFLGRIQDPRGFKDLADPDLKIFNDPAFRVILVAKTKNIRLLQHCLGKDKAVHLLSLNNQITRAQLSKFEGRNVELQGAGFVASFLSVSQAVQCALAIQKNLHVAAELIDLRIGIHAGMPVSNDHTIFGNVVNMASYLCWIGEENQIVISSMIHELYKEDTQTLNDNSRIRSTNASEENFLKSLMNTLGENWQNHDFNINVFSEKMSMSKSQLYRKCTALTGMSPNTLLREYRLLKSLRMLESDRNIMQTAFEVGFGNPSYFTNCFHKKFGLHPKTYLKYLD